MKMSTNPGVFAVAYHFLLPILVRGLVEAGACVIKRSEEKLRSHATRRTRA